MTFIWRALCYEVARAVVRHNICINKTWLLSLFDNDVNVFDSCQAYNCARSHSARPSILLIKEMLFDGLNKLMDITAKKANFLCLLEFFCKSEILKMFIFFSTKKKLIFSKNDQISNRHKNYLLRYCRITIQWSKLLGIIDWCALWGHTGDCACGDHAYFHNDFKKW